MNKKLEHSRLYLIILISVFSLVVIGATYAIFATDKNFGAMANLQAHAGSAYAFTSTSATDFTIDLKASDMKDENIGNYVSSTNGTINVSLTSPEGMATYCTYDLLFTWNSSDKYTTPDVALPYTHTDNKTYNYEFSTLVTDKDTGNIEFAERDLSKVNNGVGFSGNSGTIAEGLFIEADSTTVSKTYNIDARIYILPIIQNNIEGKNMHASIKVDNVNCQYEIEEQVDVSTLNYLSTSYVNTIFNLVNKQGVDVTNVDSVYFVDTSATKPGNAENIALFRGTDNNVIKAWTNGNNLYIGSKGTTYPGPSMARAFYNMQNLNVLDMNNVNTSNVTNMSLMFDNTGYSSTNFTLNLGNQFNTAKVTNMSFMFSNTGHNTKNFVLNLREEFDTTNVRDMSSMFTKFGAYSNNFTFDLGNYFNMSNVTSMANMFQNAGYYSNNLVINFGNNFDASKVSDMSYLFSDAGYSSHNFTINLGNNFNASKATFVTKMFFNVGNYSYDLNLDLGNNFNLVSAYNVANMFRNSARNGNNFIMNLGKHFGGNNIKYMQNMFYMVGYLTNNLVFSLGNYFNTSKAINMSSMFSSFAVDHEEAFTLDLGGYFNTSNVTNMKSMFSSIAVSASNFSLKFGNHFNTAKVKDMSSMFSNIASSADTLNLHLDNNFNTTNVVNMARMFYQIGGNTNNLILNLGTNFDTSNVTNFSNMFFWAGFSTNSFSINIGNNFKTYNGKNLKGMFYNLGPYTSSYTLDLKGFDFSIAEDYTDFISPYHSSGNVITLFCSPLNVDYINSIVNGSLAYNVLCDPNDFPLYTISLDSSTNNVTVSKTSAYAHELITLTPPDGYIIISFKVNGEKIESNSFRMPDTSVSITDVEVGEAIVVQSSHYPYESGLSNYVYFQQTFENVSSLIIDATYQLNSTDALYLLSGASYSESLELGGNQLVTTRHEFFTNNIKILFNTPSSSNNYYGFKISIMPIYVESDDGVKVPVS